MRHACSCRARAARARATKAPAKSTTAAGRAPATPKQPALSPLGQPLVSDSPASKLGRRSFHTLSIAGLAKPALWVCQAPRRSLARVLRVVQAQKASL